MKKIEYSIVVAFLVILTYSIFLSPNKSSANEEVMGTKSAKVFTDQELKKYDGSNPELPILLALDGKVYDVTTGKDFYKVGGPYHSLAGKDSSQELHVAGGGIIKRTYPVIGEYVN